MRQAPQGLAQGLNAELLAFDRVKIRLEESACVSISWTWRFGEQWAALGRDDSGKALLVRALLGQAPVQGEIRGPHGAPGEAEGAPERTVAVVSPEVQRRTVLAQTSFYQSRWHSGVQEGQSTVREFLSQASVEDRNPFEVNPTHGDPRAYALRRQRFVSWLGVEPLLGRRVAHLSTGELRKTLLVRALLRKPRLLVLEDAFAGLDRESRSKLAEGLSRLMRARVPVLIVTDREDEILEETTHLLVFAERRMIGQGPKGEMLDLWHRLSNEQGARSGSRSDRRGTGLGTKWRRRPFPQTGELLLDLRAVTVTGRRSPILRRLTWEVRAGECWLVLGPNGAGKSTLLNIIQGDHPQSYSQEIRWFGQSIESTQALWQIRQRLGWMSPELHQHYPAEWPVRDVVASGFFNSMGLFELCSRSKRALAWRCLEWLGLEGRARRLFGELSFAEQRLVLLARAVVKEPALLILDEPCQGLDSDQRRLLLAAVDQVIGESGASLLYVTHLPREVPRCITHRLRLKRGEIQLAEPV
jgi:molybdate transport system ATP-binding protein